MQSVPKPINLPIAIPQVSIGPGMPFVRCFSDCLMEHGISMGDFLQFLEDLNEAAAADPTLQNIQTASAFVPLLQIPGGHLLKMGMKAGSKFGQQYITKSRGEHFLEEANAAFFQPRGLSASIVSTDELHSKLNVTYSPQAHQNAAQGTTLAERQALALSGFIAPLTFEVPPSTSSEASNQARQDMHGRRYARSSRRQHADGTGRHSRLAERREARAEQRQEKEATKLHWLLLERPLA